jgi:hypothetical protein
MGETAQLTGVGWAFVVIGAILALVGLVLAAMPPSAPRLAGWARRYGFALTAGNRPVVDRYLRRTRALQVAGAGIGFLASPIYVGISGRPFPLGDSWVALAVGGYLVAAVAAEATFLRPSPALTSDRAATLSPRRLTDYIPSATIWAIRSLPLVAVALSLVYGVAPKDPQRELDPSATLVLVVSAVLVVFAIAIETTLRAIVARPQPAMSEDIVAADDAVRASSIHALSGAAVALILLAAGWDFVSVGEVTSVTILIQVLPWLGVLTDVAALAAWIGLGHPRSWRVQRATPIVSAG